MPKRRTIQLGVSWTVAVFSAVGLCWFAFLPYPLKTYMEARRAVRYSPQWAISPADYRAALDAARAEVGCLEIVERVSVLSGTKVSFQTLRRWDGPLSADGQELIVEKVGGKWTVVERWDWFS